MEDLFKKFIYAGVGFVSRTNDRVQDTINQLVKENKLSQSEGEKIMSELMKNTDTKRKEFETQLSSIAKRVMKGMGVASDSDVAELKKAVRGGSKSSSSAAASKTATSSTGGTKKASSGSSSSAAGKAAAAPKAAAKAAGAASTAAKKSAAGSKGGAASGKKPAAAGASEGGSSASNA
ncbi:hypothetical protein F0P96_18025 [Hymenobacter busanensis]|uniref:Uncharacterized protein n=1 Tax=Hymenobacter busanensis TaxID=2607656 RepID=A0A7L4ZWJ9_9BACT|nr:hypothetical protein [Hymenobacter busanensis]KAA9327135.1 hypothetical protein F0P96_18025 [Hymenobacter busanensis]QHJ05800.1 hypothetical protein GUY19_00225 [Hymenobacter busanensis]